MTEAPVQLIVAAFNEEHAADQALKELKAAKKEHLIGIQAAAVVRRDEHDKLHVKEVGELTKGKGAAGGLIIGALIGLLTGGTGLVLGGAGALAGYIAGKKHDIGFSNERLQQIGDSLTPGTSAILAVIEHKWVAQLEQELEELGADVMTEAISADIAAQLAQGKDVAYTAVASEEGLATGRIAGKEGEVEASSTVITDEGMVHTEAVATDAGFAAERITATSEGVVDEVVVATDEGVAYVADIVTDEGETVIGAVAVPEVAETDEPTEDKKEDA